MTGISPVERAVSRRARAAIQSGRSSAQVAPERGVLPDRALIEYLRRHLHQGETHYPARPGMTPLRERVDGRLSELGLPSRGTSSVLITASEGEALFVTLLGLDAVPDGTVRGTVPDEHRALLAWTGVTVLNPEAGEAAASTSSPRVTVIGATLFGADSLLLDSSEIIVGSLDGLDGMAPFTLGFVAGESAIISKITKWKQASSICSPAPSQRAALWALGERS